MVGSGGNARSGLGRQQGAGARTSEHQRRLARQLTRQGDLCGQFVLPVPPFGLAVLAGAVAGAASVVAHDGHAPCGQLPRQAYEHAKRAALLFAKGLDQQQGRARWRVGR